MYNHKIRLISNSGVTLFAVEEATVNALGSGSFTRNSNAKWIWTSGSYQTISDYQSIIPFSGSFVSHSAYTGTIELAVDDVATVYFNGHLIGGTNYFTYVSFTNGHVMQRTSISVIAGTNRIVVNAQNTGGPAGLLINIRDNNGTYVYATDSSWKYPSLPNVITTYAGTGAVGNSGDGGVATSALLNGPHGVALDVSQNLYISEKVNNKIRKISSSGIVSSYAGTGTAGSNGDGGAASSAQLNHPEGIFMDATHSYLYIADTYNHKIRRISSAGIITTFAGTGTIGGSGDYGLATNAQLNAPVAVTTDVLGNVYIADSNNNKIRLVTLSSGIITTFAGTGCSGIGGDGAAAVSAQLCNPQGLVIDQCNNLYITDFYNNRIRLVNSTTGNITTIAGASTMGSSATSFTYLGCYMDNSNGIRAMPNLIYSNKPGYQACFNQAQVLGYRYVGFDAWNAGWQAGTNAGECWGGNSLTIAESQGTSINCNAVTTTDGNFIWAGGQAMALYDTTINVNQFNGPLGIAVDTSGNLYVADFYDNTVRLLVQQ